MQTKYRVVAIYNNGNISGSVYDTDNKPAKFTETQLKKIERIAYRRKQEIGFIKSPECFNFELDENLNLILLTPHP